MRLGDEHGLLDVGSRVPAKEGQPGALHPLQISLHPLGICKMSETKMLIRSENCENNIKRQIHTQKRGEGAQLLLAESASRER